MMMQTLRRWPQPGVLLAAAMLIAACGSEPAVQSVSPADLAGRIGQGTAPAIFDVRTAAEYAEGHVPGAINLPHTEVADRVDEFSVYRDREVVVYCRSGKRAGMAQAELVAAGFSNVVDLEGHMLQWEAGGFPVDRVIGAGEGDVAVIELE